MTREKTKQGGPEAGIIYCRVSSKKQVSEGNGLQSQEITCREFMDRNGIKVLGVFRDDLTGKTAHRNGFRDALAFLKACCLGTKVVIDDGDRLARGMRAHFLIRDAIVAAGGKLVSPEREYTDDPEDDILKIVEAAFAGEHRRKNAAQTLSRMRGRCLAGHWCLQLPRGYKYRKDKSKGQGAIIDRDEPIATIVQQALEGFACGHLETQADVARYFASQPGFPRQKSGRVPDEVARIILRNPLYAGYVHVPHWDVSLRQGHHPALISFETFKRFNAASPGPRKASSARTTRGTSRCAAM